MTEKETSLFFSFFCFSLLFLLLFRRFQPGCFESDQTLVRSNDALSLRFPSLLLPRLDAESIEKSVINVFPKSAREQAGDLCEPPFTLGEATRAERTFHEVLLLIVLTRRYVVK